MDRRFALILREPLLLHHMSQSHPAELRPLLDQMHTTDDMTPAIVQAFEAVEEPAC
jgi:hypothetical protein